MRLLPAEFHALLRSIRRHGGIRALVTLALVLVVLAVTFTLMFHLLMLREGQEHSLLTGLYWTLTVMSTLGFGDVTFSGDLGRAFSMLVLLTGLAVLIFAIPTVFAEYVFKPWLNERDTHSAPRTLAEGIRGHVVICNYDAIADGLIPRLKTLGIESVVLEADMARATQLHADGVRVVCGGRSALETFRAVRTREARAVLANLGDAENTSVVLTVREVAPGTPVIALAEARDAVDILKLAGATEVVPLKQRLAQQLARRVGEGMEVAHRIGRVGGLVIAEFPIHGTKLAKRTLGATNLHEHAGVNIVAVWERGVLLPARAEHQLSENSVLVLVGTEEQLTDLDALFVIYHAHDAPVLVIGGGAVGREVCAALRKREVPVTVLERDRARRGALAEVADRVLIGDAAHKKNRHRRGRARSTVGGADDERRRHEYFSRRVLPQTARGDAHREPHHAHR